MLYPVIILKIYLMTFYAFYIILLGLLTFTCLYMLHHSQNVANHRINDTESYPYKAQIRTEFKRKQGAKME